MLPTTLVAPTCPLSTAGRLDSLCGDTYVVQMRTPSSITWNKSSASEERWWSCSVTTTLSSGAGDSQLSQRWLNRLVLWVVRALPLALASFSAGVEGGLAGSSSYLVRLSLLGLFFTTKEAENIGEKLKKQLLKV